MLFKKDRTVLKYLPCPVLLLLYFLFMLPAAAQTKKVDSLRTLLYSTHNDTKRLPLLLALCEQHNSIHTDTLYAYYSSAYTIAAQTKNEDGKLNATFFEATYLNKKGRYDAALLIIDSVVNLLQSRQINTALRFRFQVLKSNVLIRSGKQKEAIQNCLNVLHESEKLHDDFTQLRAYNNIGWGYMELGQNSTSLSWLLKAKKIDESQNVFPHQSYLYSNIAAVYNNLGKTDSGEYFIKKALNYAIENQELSYEANCIFIYASITDDRGEKETTEKLLKDGIKIRKLIGDPFYIVSDIFQLGLFYANNKETAKGIAVLKEGIETAIENNLYEKLPILYTSLAENYKAEGNYIKYGATLDTLILLKDSLYKKNSAEALAEMQAKYDLQKKENTIIEQKFELSKKNDLIYGSVAVLFATIILGALYIQNKKKGQQLKLQAVEIEQKKNTARAVMQAEEHERKRIAAELHDSVAQKMVVAKLNLEALNNATGISTQEQKILLSAQSLLDESTTEVRNLSHIMMPQSLALSGLAATVKDFLDKIIQPQLRIDFNVSGNLDAVSNDVALMVYRIIQECVQNILKHANASAIDISMIADDKALDVTIEDNGKGFDTKSALASSASGLKNIRSRIGYLNGTLDINSIQGKGTTIAFYVPLLQ